MQFSARQPFHHRFRVQRLHEFRNPQLGVPPEQSDGAVAPLAPDICVQLMISHTDWDAELKRKRRTG